MKNNSKGTILVTDTLFIGPSHENRLREAGYKVERLNSACATQEELAAALLGKVGYILGGMESVTASVIERCDKLRAIAFTGSDYRAFIPGWESAKSRGIAISNCPGANSDAVAELAVTGFIMLSRGILDLGRLGNKTFLTTKSISEYRFGIVGMGPLARTIVKKLIGLGATDIVYENRTRYPAYEQEFGLQYRSLAELFGKCNGIFLATAAARGAGFIGKPELDLLQPGSIISNCSFEAAIDPQSSLAALSTGRCKIFQDSKPAGPDFDSIPAGDFYWTNQIGYNTKASLETVSDLATESIINLLETGEDRHRAM